jgi:hypothetical protein
LLSLEFLDLPLEAQRRRALIPEGSNSCIIDIDISEYEYCGAERKKTIRGVVIHGYTRELLLDAMGRGINDLEASLAAMTTKARPARVVMVIITDGQENSSHEFTKGQIEKMIKAKQDKSDWQFVFLSADLAAIDDAVKTGVKMCCSMAFDKDAHGTSAAFSSVSERISDYRGKRAPAVAFNEEDRAQQKSEKKR